MATSNMAIPNRIVRACMVLVPASKKKSIWKDLKVRKVKYSRLF